LTKVDWFTIPKEAPDTAWVFIGGEDAKSVIFQASM
jgi:hypothetical protein